MEKAGYQGISEELTNKVFRSELENFIRHLEQEKLSPNTISGYQRIITYFLLFCQKNGYRELSDIRTDDVGTFIVSLYKDGRYRSATVGSGLSGLRRFLSSNGHTAQFLLEIPVHLPREVRIIETYNEREIAALRSMLSSGMLTKRDKVLEAKLVLSDKIVISMDTEFIENENESVSKQDCEITAAKRLLKRLAKDYPRLPVCIQGDGLYAAELIMKICRQRNWKYIFTHKAARQKLLDESYEWIRQGNGSRKVGRIGKEKGTGEYVNHVEETAGKEETANLFSYSYETEKEGKKQTITFKWITNIELTEKNLEEMINAARGRWKIENEGFNNQKNGIYDIEHLNSRNGNAMKNHYLLTQVADIIMQIYLAWNPLRKEINQSIKNTSSWLLESFRRQTITDEDVFYIQRYTTVYLE